MQELINLSKQSRELNTGSLWHQVYENFAFRLEEISFKGLNIDKDYACTLDYFQYHYALYLCKIVKSGHRSYFEFRSFINHPYFEQSHYDKLLEEIETFLLEREMYESLSLFVKTNKKFKKELKNARSIKF